MSGLGIFSNYVLYDIFLPLGWVPLFVVPAPLVSWYQTKKVAESYYHKSKFYPYDLIMQLLYCLLCMKPKLHITNYLVLY